MDAKSILKGMEEGFGEGIRQSSPRIKLLISQGRDDVVKNLIHGYGSKVSAHSSPLTLILIVVGVLALALTLIKFWRNRTNPALTNKPGKANRQKTAGGDENEDGDPSKSELSDALDSLKELDK